jgi:hypothetical protein
LRVCIVIHSLEVLRSSRRKVQLIVVPLLNVPYKIYTQNFHIQNTFTNEFYREAQNSDIYCVLQYIKCMSTWIFFHYKAIFRNYILVKMRQQILLQQYFKWKIFLKSLYLEYNCPLIRWNTKPQSYCVWNFNTTTTSANHFYKWF